MLRGGQGFSSLCLAGQLLGVKAENRSYHCLETWYFLHHSIKRLTNGNVSYLLYFSYFILTIVQATVELSSKYADIIIPEFL